MIGFDDEGRTLMYYIELPISFNHLLSIDNIHAFRQTIDVIFTLSNFNPLKVIDDILVSICRCMGSDAQLYVIQYNSQRLHGVFVIDMIRLHKSRETLNGWCLRQLKAICFCIIEISRDWLMLFNRSNKVIIVRAENTLDLLIDFYILAMDGQNHVCCCVMNVSYFQKIRAKSLYMLSRVKIKFVLLLMNEIINMRLGRLVVYLDGIGNKR